MKSKNKVIIIDFGSQTCHLISRRIRELGVEVEIVVPEILIREMRRLNLAGIILSGGPASIDEKGAPRVGKKIFALKIPVLGICYGHQLMAYLLGGKVKPGKKKEFGPATLVINRKTKLLEGLSPHSRVWMSHGDEVIKLPVGFVAVAQTKSVPLAVMMDEKRKFFGLQFHPEVEHTEHGKMILRNFVKICGLKTKKRVLDLEEMIKEIRGRVKSGEKAIAAVSGGVDSTVAAVLVAKAIGKDLIPVYIDSGLMRLGTKDEVISLFTKDKLFKRKPIIIEAKEQFLKELKGVTDPEEKRKVIGKLYIDLFEKEAKKIKGVKFLVQGTIYSDVIESKGTKHASKIKSHHNVGGLPARLKLELIEPLKDFYKDEVREIGRSLALTERIIKKQPFPGPGQAIRIIGEVTKERLMQQQQADEIILEELRRADWLDKVFQSFPVMTNTKSTAVKGDARFYGEVVALRIYESADIMTAGWSQLPYDLLQKISSRMVNEIEDISRVVYDITTKPPATMEWE